MRDFFQRWRIRLRPYRDALIYLVFTAIFSLLPTISGLLFLYAFGQWNGDWARLLRNGDLLVASAGLMATALATFRRADNPNGFWKSISGLGATIIIVGASLVYAGLALSTYEILPKGVEMVPKALVTLSVGLYASALVVGFYALVLEQDRVPSNLEIRDQQVSKLENDLNQLGGSNE